jgi:hypothetical protein
VRKNAFRLSGDFFLSIALRQPRLIAIQKIEDDLTHLVPGLLFGAPVIDFLLLLPKQLQEIDGYLLDALDVFPFQIWLLQQIEQRQRLFLEPLTNGACRLFIQLGYQP